MIELIQTAFSPVNAVATVLLILNVICWITVILGVLDVDFLNIELPDSGLEIDSDIEVDVDAAGEIDTGLGDQSFPSTSSGQALRSVLHFFYIGEVPIMLLLSILILSMWMLCMFGNHYFNPRGSFLVALPVYGISLVSSLVICRIFAMPLKKIYDMFNKDYNAPMEVIGRICTVTTTSVSDKMGQAEVKTKGAPIVLNVISDGEHVFHKGDEAVVVSRDNERGIYKIAPLDFVELYTDRMRFREQILDVIGTDLSGYVLEDAAIDYLEQTDKKLLNPDNILDSEGIKKITVLTAEQFELANDREREKDKTITKQNAEAEEAILELNKQLAEAEAKQKREIASIQAREEAETKKVQQAEREKAEKARIGAEEEIYVAEQNKERQVIVATRNKERTDAIELERVERDRGLEATERERVVSIAQVDKEKAVEAEKKELQAVIRERVMVEKTVVTEEEKIKDTREFATAERHKSVQITKAEEEAEQALVKDIKAAEAAKKAEEFYAEQKLIDADANLKAADKSAQAKKTLALASIKEHAVEGTAEAEVLEAKAVAIEKQGAAEAKVMELKYHADADGIRDKAEAMKIFDAVGKEHEEFKLRLNKDLEIELAEINIRKEIAAEQAKIVAEALKAANIEIIGGENQFFERLVNAITTGKSVDRAVNSSGVLTDLKQGLIGSDEQNATQQIRRFVSQFGLTSEDVKNLTISALVAKLIAKSDKENKGVLNNLLNTVKELGMGNKPAKELGLS